MQIWMTPPWKMRMRMRICKTLQPRSLWTMFRREITWWHSTEQCQQKSEKKQQNKMLIPKRCCCRMTTAGFTVQKKYKLKPPSPLGDGSRAQGWKKQTPIFWHVSMGFFHCLNWCISMNLWKYRKFDFQVWAPFATTGCRSRRGWEGWNLLENDQWLLVIHITSVLSRKIWELWWFQCSTWFATLAQSSYKRRLRAGTLEPKGRALRAQIILNTSQLGSAKRTRAKSYYIL